jgi:aspartyl-tRNA(Asn)/glutamyl-tRNA(Gln) amidotransferase subunit A
VAARRVHTSKKLSWVPPARSRPSPCGLRLPCGFASVCDSKLGTRNPKLPTGLQLLGKPLGEETILRIAHAYEQSTEWHKEKPAL